MVVYFVKLGLTLQPHVQPAVLSNVIRTRFKQLVSLPLIETASLQMEQASVFAFLQDHSTAWIFVILSRFHSKHVAVSHHLQTTVKSRALINRSALK